MTEALLLILLPIIAAILLYFIPGRIGPIITLAVQSAVAALAVRLFLDVRHSGVILENPGGWPPAIGIRLLADPLSVVLVLLTALLYWFLALFNLKDPLLRKPFPTMFLMLEGLLIGVFLSGDLFNIYVLIEAATIVVTLLILFDKKKRSFYDGLYYFMVNMVAMVLFLFGLGLLYRQTGLLDMVVLKSLLEQVDSSARSGLILPFALMTTAVALKSALFPLFSWLPKAHGTPGAPIAVSALLSGLYVKTGVYLLFRLMETFAPIIDASLFFEVIALITAFAGIGLAMIQTDIKRLLGYSTISQIGLIIFGFTYGSDSAQAGAMLHILNHALFKSVLFLAAGLIVKHYDTSDIRKIRGVFHHMPVISTAAIMAMLGVTGAPLFNGSVSKYLIKNDFSDGVLSVVLILINLGTVLYCLKLSTIFFPAPNPIASNKSTGSAATMQQPASSKRMPAGTVVCPYMRFVTVSLAMICLLTGIFGGFLADYLFAFPVLMTAAVFLDNLLAWLLTLAVGFAIYRLIRRCLIRWQKLCLIESGFNQISMGLAAFLLLQIVWLIYF